MSVEGFAFKIHLREINLSSTEIYSYQTLKYFKGYECYNRVQDFAFENSCKGDITKIESKEKQPFLHMIHHLDMMYNLTNIKISPNVMEPTKFPLVSSFKGDNFLRKQRRVTILTS